MAQRLQVLLRLPAGVRASAHDVQLVLQEEAGAVGEAPVDDGAEAARAGVRAGVLRVQAGVADVNGRVGASDVHVAHAHAAAVEVAVLEQVHGGVGEDECDVQAVGFGNRGRRGRFHGAERPEGGGSGGGRVKIRVVVFHRALSAGGAARRTRGTGRPGRGDGEARRGRRRQDARAAVTGWGAVGLEGGVCLWGVGLGVFLQLDGAADAWDVAARKETQNQQLTTCSGK